MSVFACSNVQGSKQVRQDIFRPRSLMNNRDLLRFSADAYLYEE